MIIKKVPRSSRKYLFNTTIFLAAFTLFPATFPAPLWGGCHCIKDRAFDPLQPASADPYVVATTRNSLVAAASGSGKGNVVKMRMTGASEADVWLSMYLESPKGKEDAASTPAFREAEKQGDREAMAIALADRVLERTYGPDAGVLASLRKAGADTAAVALSLMVSRRTGKPGMEIFTGVRDGGTTWGKTLNAMGIVLDTTGDLIMGDVGRATEGRP